MWLSAQGTSVTGVYIVKHGNSRADSLHENNRHNSKKSYENSILNKKCGNDKKCMIFIELWALVFLHMAECQFAGCGFFFLGRLKCCLLLGRTSLYRIYMCVCMNIYIINMHYSCFPFSLLQMSCTRINETTPLSISFLGEEQTKILGINNDNNSNQQQQQQQKITKYGHSSHDEYFTWTATKTKIKTDECIRWDETCVYTGFLFLFPSFE